MSFVSRVRVATSVTFGIFMAGISTGYIASAQSSAEQPPNASPITKRQKTAFSTPVFIENKGPAFERCAIWYNGHGNSDAY